MTPSIDCFVVGHWSIERNLTQVLINVKTHNFFECEADHKKVVCEGEEMFAVPHDNAYVKIVGMFSKEGSVVMDLGSGTGTCIFFFVWLL